MESSEAEKRQSGTKGSFLGSWKEFFAVIGLMLVVLVILIAAGSHANAGQRAEGAANLFGTLGAIYVVMFFIRRSKRTK